MEKFILWNQKNICFNIGRKTKSLMKKHKKLIQLSFQMNYLWEVVVDCLKERQR